MAISPIRLTAFLVATVLLACSSGARAQSCPANIPHVTGTWEVLPYRMPVNPISANLMPNGKILIVSGSENTANNSDVGTFRAAVWDPTGTGPGSIVTQHVNYDIFCSSVAQLPDGRSLVVGGTSDYTFTGEARSSFFDWQSGAFAQTQNMAAGRWYASAITLGDGRVVAMSGLNQTGGTTNKVEIYDLANAGAGWTTSTNFPVTPPLYPRIVLLPSGNVYYTGQGSGGMTAQSYLFNPTSGTWTASATTTRNRTYGGAVLLPLMPPNYTPKVMNFGGGNPAVASTEIIDLSAGSPTWTAGPNMSTGRTQMNVVLLPNGRVLAEGGSVNNDASDLPGKSADLYNSVNNTMGSAGTSAFSRMYHSTTVLLPDARVAVLGSNPLPRGIWEPNLEIYTPPYLFDANDQLITTNRPAITALSPSSGVLRYNTAFSVSFTSSTTTPQISSAVLMRLGSSTHAYTMEQRMIGLCGPSPQPTCSTSNNTLNLTTPPNGNIAPPGYYMLFLLDGAGVPSQAQFIQLTPYSTVPPTSTITSPAATNVTISAGGTVSFGTSTTASNYAWIFPGGTPASSTAQNPGNVTFPSAGVYTASLTVADSSGNSDPHPPTRTITVLPTTADFTITAGPAAAEVNPGGTATFNVNVTAQNGFTGAVALTVTNESGFPTGVSGSFSPSTINGSGSSTLTMSTTSATVPYAVTLTITGKSGTLTHLASATLVINVAPPSVSANPGSGQVSLSWPASVGASIYEVKRGTVSGGPYLTRACPSTTNFVDLGLTNGTAYYYVVGGAYTTNVNGGGESTNSAEASATPSGSGGGTGSLTGSGVQSTAVVNLTTVGTSDWVKWPGYIHKASGGAQIPTFSATGTVLTYNNDTRPISWTDGTPTATGTNDISGNYVGGIGNGFQITAPADTSTRTLNVYVGGFTSGGRLVAHLSDGSAADYVDASFSASSGQYKLVYTLTYRAASAGQQLVVQWTQASGTGNVTLQAVALAGSQSGAPSPPTGVSASDGTSGTSVTVTWTASAGATSYSVFRSTNSGTQGSSVGNTNNTSLTDTTVTPGTLYYYSVVATNASGSSAASAQDSGFAGTLPSGSLSGSGVSSFAAVNLTSTGTADWAKWPNYIHKSSGGSQISNFTKIGTPAVQTYNNDQRPMSWTDGTPTATGTNDITGNFIAGIGNGFQITAPADTTQRTLIVYVGGWVSGGKLVAHLSDGSAADYVDTSFSSTTDQYRAVYTLTYSAASAGKQLVIQWTQASGTGNVIVQAVALAGAQGAPPSPPTGVSATDGTSATTVTVTWTASSGATSYSIFRSTTQGTTGSSVGTSSTTSFTDTTLTAGVQYYYSVAAINAAGSSAPSAQDGGYAGTLPTTPAAPTGVDASDGTSATSVTVTWTASSGATGYSIFRSTTLGTTGSSVGTSTTTSFTDTTVTASVQYYYSVVATNTAGSSAPSAQDGGYAGTLPTPPVPTGVAASDGTSATSVTVTWTASAGATGYSIFRSTTQGTTGSSVGTSTTTSFTDTTVTPGVQYYFSVAATNAGGSSAPSAQDGGYAGTLPTPPAAPTGVAASDGTSATSVTVTWTASSGATGYSIFRSTTQGSTGSSVGTSTTTSFTDATVTAGVLYYYSVVATNAAGSSTPSAQDSGFAGTLPPGGSLTGSGVASFAAVNLTTSGTSDWAKWPNYIHKASGGSQISNFTKIGTPAVQTYNDDQRPISWTDGTPTATGTNDINGNFIGGIGNGFQISAPADTTTRTLLVYVGGWTSGGKLVAHLSDSSAADFVDTSFSSTTGQYKLVYTLTYSAASAGKQLVVQWTQASGSGNVTLQAVALSGSPAGPPAPTGVAASDGTSATTVAVSWSASAGATGYSVFRSTASGTTGSQVGTSTTTGFTDTTVTAGVLYFYSVVATNSSGSSVPSAQDSGYAGTLPAGGSLTGSGVSSFAAVNLTTTGTSDWAKWPNYIHKASGGSQISNFTKIGTPSVQTYNDDQRPISWTDGTPTATGTNDITGNFIRGIGTGFQITAPADTTTRTLIVYVGGWTSGGKLVAHLSDGSAADFVDTSFSSTTGQYKLVYTLTYRAASAGKQLVVQWTQASGTGNVTVQAAALQ